MNGTTLILLEQGYLLAFYYEGTKNIKQPPPRHTPSWVRALCLGNAARAEAGSRWVADQL